MQKKLKLLSIPLLTTTLFLSGAANVFADDSGVPAIVALSALMVSQINGEVEGFTLVPSFGYQHKTLEFDQKLRFAGQAGTDADFKVEIPTANFSFTAGYQKVFATLKYEKSLADVSTEANESLQPNDPQYYFNIPGGVTEIDREDISITVGYNVAPNLNIFAGYMTGETIINPDKGCDWPIGSNLETCNNVAGNPPGPFNPQGRLNLAFTQEYFGEPQYEQTYIEEGPYIGFSYSLQVAEAGTLSLSAAYADMDGEYSDNYLKMIDRNFDFAGDSKGTSLGLTWTAPLGETSNYFLDIRRQAYEMDAKDDNGNYPDATAKTKETMTGVTAGIQFYF